MANQEIVLTMHPLNKYGVPCSDVTDYPNRSSATSVNGNDVGTFYLQKASYEYFITTKLKSIGGIPIPDPFEPVTGIIGFNFCFFRNDSNIGGSGSGYVDYYSLGSGALIKTVQLPDQIAGSSDSYLLPHVAIENSYVTAGLLNHTEAYQLHTRNADGTLTLNGFIDVQMTLPQNSVTRYDGDIVIDKNGQTIVMPFYDGCWLEQDTSSLIPSNIRNGAIHFNSFAVNNDGFISQSGRLYREILPTTIQSDDPDVKRNVVSKDDLFVGTLVNYVKQVEAYTLISNDVLDWYLSFLGWDLRNHSHLLVDVFDQDYDDGNPQSKIGTGIIVGRYFNNALFICVASELKNSNSGIRSCQRWFNSAGQFLYDFIYPSSEIDPTIQYTSGRINYGSYFFYVVVNTDGDAYLRTYSLYSGIYVEHPLVNPYQYEGPYQLKNRELVGGKYLVLNTTAGHLIFFDAMNPESGIQGEVIIPVSTQEESFSIIPQIGDNQPASTVTNKLLELCNDIRNLKMTWAANQVYTCQAHADWCTANGVFQHEGPGLTDTVRERNNVVGIYAGVSENITTVITSNSEQEQIEAFTNWIGSPRHLEGIIRAGNKYMSYAESTYPVGLEELQIAAGMWNPITQTYELESKAMQIPVELRGKLKLYVQNFIWY